MVESRASSGLFAVIRRENDGGQVPPMFRRNRRSANPEDPFEEDELEGLDFGLAGIGGGQLGSRE